MAWRSVVEVCERWEVCEHTCLLVIVVVLLKCLDCRSEVSFESVSTYIVVAIVSLICTTSCLIELCSVSVCHTHSDEGRSRNLSSLSDFITDVISVEDKRKSLSDFSLSFFSCFSCETAVSWEDIFVYVPADIICSDLSSDNKFVWILNLESWDFFVWNIVDEEPVAVLEVRKHVVGIIGEVELDFVHCHLVSIWVIWVLCKCDYRVVLPSCELIHTVGNICRRICCPRFVRNNIFSYWVVCWECKKFVPVSNIVI